MSNTGLWERHRTPPKDALKKFKRRGGFQGTSIDPMWVIFEATQEWGPMGSDWGYEVVSESIERLGEEWILHTCNIDLWYMHERTGRSLVPSTGNTWLVAPGKYGPQYDDEATKKSRTDAIGKALSWLGFGADIYMGMFDGDKYSDLFEDAPTPTKSSDNATNPPQPEPTTEDSDQDEWTSDIPDDILDLVVENISIIKSYVGDDQAKQWHSRVLPNFLGVDKGTMKKGVMTAIKGLEREQLAELAVLQNDKIKMNKED